MIVNDKELYGDMMGELLTALGYQDVKKTKGNLYDRITAVKDGETYLFASRYDIDAISGAVMEDFINQSADIKADNVIFMTNSSFASSAKKEAETAGVQLWDRNHIDRISIGVDVNFHTPKQEDKTVGKGAVLVGIVVVILIAALAIYLYPQFF